MRWYGWYLSDLGNGNPFNVQLMSGAGLPRAWHLRETIGPGCIVWSMKVYVKTGEASKREKKDFQVNDWSFCYEFYTYKNKTKFCVKLFFFVNFLLFSAHFSLSDVSLFQQMRDKELRWSKPTDLKREEEEKFLVPHAINGPLERRRHSRRQAAAAAKQQQQPPSKDQKTKERGGFAITSPCLLCRQI